MHNAVRNVVGGVILSGYLVSIIGTILICSILTAILPSGKTSGIIKGIAKLACVISIVAPIPQFMQKETAFDTTTQNNNINFLQSSIKTDKSFIEYYCEMRVKSAEEQLNVEIAEKFDVLANVEIDWCFPIGKQYDTDAISITNIKVSVLDDYDATKKTAVLEYIKEHYCEEVSIE